MTFRPSDVRQFIACSIARNFKMASPLVKFYNRNTCPILGLGTWKSKPNEVTQAVKDAIDLGYRHIDCAPVYGNEKEVGEAIAAKIEEGVIKREDIFITSKLWNTKHRPELVEPALRKTLNDLGLEYLDLYLMHSPMGFKDGDEIFPVDASGNVISDDTDYVDTWKAMEQLVAKGLVKNIGASNFNSQQLERLIANCKVKPVTNQVECHPYYNQSKMSVFCYGRGITITAYSPFGAPDRPFGNLDEPKILEDTKINELAAKYKKTAAQLILRFIIQCGHIVIPKSVTKSRIEENLKVFDFEISPEDMDALKALNRNKKYCVREGIENHKYNPFKAEF